MAMHDRSPRREEIRQRAKEEGSREEAFVYTCPVQHASHQLHTASLN